MTKLIYSSAKDILVLENGLTVEVSARATTEGFGEGLDIDLSISKVYVTISDKKSQEITSSLDRESKELITDELHEIYDDFFTYGIEKDEDKFNGKNALQHA